MRFGVDANVLLRVLLNDHPQQSMQARDLLASLREERRGYVGISAVLQIFWVLRSRYRVPRQALYEMMRQLLSIRHVDVESPEAVAQALSAYRQGRAEFADALLAGRNVEAGCSFTYTFDRDAVKGVESMKDLGAASSLSGSGPSA